MDKRYQVFVSSTFTDLVDERQHVIEALIRMGCIPAGMEFFPASGIDKWEYIKKVIDDCDYYLLIVGGRYGSMDDDGISYTEKEYDYAVKKKLTVISFVHKNPGFIPLQNSELDPALRKKLHAFREKVTSGLVGFWEHASDLTGLTAMHIAAAIREHPASGWVKGNIDIEDVRKFPNFEDAKKFIVTLIKKESVEKNVHIKWIGSSMLNATPLIEDDIIPLCERTNRKLFLEITMLNSEWDGIDKYNKSWKQQLRRYSGHMDELLNNNSDVVQKLTIHTYKQVPHITGGLINNQYLFVAYCEWDEDGQYHVGLNQRYFYYKLGDKNWDRKHIDFIKWFEHLKEKEFIIYNNTSTCSEE